MVEERYKRASLLLHQKRYQEAARELTELLALSPANPQVLALFCEVKLELGELAEAEKLIQTALGLAPEAAVLYYLKARVMLQREQYNEAESSLEQAILFDPADADFHAFWAAIKLHRKQYQAALDRANEALALDPKNLLAINTRSTALLKLNRKEESGETIAGALKEDPNNSYTHANYGWSLLEKGDPKKAMHHFGEALKNDPSSYLAQGGMLQALKARYLLYRWFLKYAFWIGNMTAKYQWAVIIGFYLATRALNRVAETNDNLRPFIFPLIVLMALVAFSTWIITPLSNLFLRLNTYGKHLLKPHEIRSANLTGISLSIGLISLLLYALSGTEGWLTLAGLGIFCMIPASVVFKPSKNSTLLWVLACILLLIGGLAVWIAFSSGVFFNLLSLVFVYGLIGFQFLTNYFLIKADNV